MTDFIANSSLLLGTVALALLAAVIVFALWRSGNQERIVSLLLERPSASGQSAKSSVSRLQMLIWNFVVAFAFLYVLAAVGVQDMTKLETALEALFNDQVLILLGISNGTYIIGKVAGRGGAAGAPGEAQDGAPVPAALRSVPEHAGSGAAPPMG